MLLNSCIRPVLLGVALFLGLGASADMTWMQAAILGVVEGLTEYLPVSSTGHLLVTQRLLDIPETDASNAYAIVIQLGAILAVLGLYYPYVRRMLTGLIGKDRSGLKLLCHLLLAFLPAAIVGLTFADTIKDRLFGLKPTVAAWFVWGVGILIWERVRRRTSETGIDSVYGLTWQRALGIGCFQVLAMWPGTSRSLVTILGGCLCGLRLSTAVIFSFLLGAVTLSASTLYDAVKYGDVMLEAYGIGNLLVGLVFAFISAAIAVKWMVGYLNRHSLSIFGYYRIAIAIAATWYFWSEIGG